VDTLPAAVPVPAALHPDAPFLAARESVSWDERFKEPVIVPSKEMGVTAGDVETVTGPESWSPFCAIVHVTRSARPPPEPAPSVPVHVPARIRSVSGPVAELHAAASAPSNAMTTLRAAIRFMCLLILPPPVGRVGAIPVAVQRQREVEATEKHR